MRLTSYAAMLLLPASMLFAEDAPDYAKLLKGAKLTLADAMAQSLKEVKDGVVVAAEIEEEKGSVNASMDVATGKTLHEVGIDIKTGKVVENNAEKEDQSDLVAAAKITLTQAIESALKKVPGSAVAAKLELSKEKPVAEVIVFADGKLTAVDIDGVSGKETGTHDPKDDPKEGDEGKEGDGK